MNDLEDAIWNAMLDSEMNALYYGYIARRYEGSRGRTKSNTCYNIDNAGKVAILRLKRPF